MVHLFSFITYPHYNLILFGVAIFNLKQVKPIQDEKTPDKHCTMCIH